MTMLPMPEKVKRKVDPAVTAIAVALRATTILSLRPSPKP